MKQLSISQRDRIIRAIKSGAIFIYPTDTVYGIGCNAEIESSVKRVRKIKKQFDRPFSVIAPSMDWIEENLYSKKEVRDKLPGPYTFILKMKKKCVADNVSLGNTLGVRIPKHEFSKLVEKAGVPFVTTSANLSGEKTPRSVKDISLKADYVIDGGELKGKASTVIDLTKGRKVPRG